MYDVVLHKLNSGGKEIIGQMPLFPQVGESLIIDLGETQYQTSPIVRIVRTSNAYYVETHNSRYKLTVSQDATT